MSSTKFVFFGPIEKKNGHPGQSAKKVAHCTQVHDMWPFGPLVDKKPKSLSRFEEISCLPRMRSSFSLRAATLHVVSRRDRSWDPFCF